MTVLDYTQLHKSSADSDRVYMWLWSACNKTLNDVRQCHDAVDTSVIIEHPQSAYLQCIKHAVHTYKSLE